MRSADRVIGSSGEARATAARPFIVHLVHELNVIRVTPLVLDGPMIR